MIFTRKYINILFTILTFFAGSVFAAQPKTEYTVQETIAIERLRATIPDIIAEDDYFTKDHYLIRWLRARNMNVTAANRMIRDTKNLTIPTAFPLWFATTKFTKFGFQTHKWREDNHIDSILAENILKFTTPPYSFQGKDKEGRPTVFFTPTSIDLRKLIVSGQRSKAVRAWDQLLERGRNIVRNSTLRMTNGEEVTQFVAILDVNGFNVRQHACIQCLGVYIEFMYHFENYFPGALKYFIIINVNRVAVPMVEFIKPIFSEATRKSLKVFSTHKPDFSKFLRSIINEDQLPFRFGGTNNKYR